MSFELSAGINESQAQQKVLDVASCNSTEVGTSAGKTVHGTFAELLSETINKASQPKSSVSDTITRHIGTNIRTSGITGAVPKSSIVNTGNPLDLAIEGRGYLVLSNGQEHLYTRTGTFTVDADSNLIDTATGFIVQRIGSVGEIDGFQAPGDSNVKIPCYVAIAANATSEVKVSGNLSADAVLSTPQTNVLTSDITYTTNGTLAELDTKIANLDQYNGVLDSGTIKISGFSPKGDAYDSNLSLSVDGTTTLNDIVSYLNIILGNNATASLFNGRITITDAVSGYSKSDINFSYSGDGILRTPGYFEVSTVGGTEVKNFDITIYDSEGSAHVMACALVRTDTANTWDMIMTSITGDVSIIDMDSRRIEGIEFDADFGCYSGLNAKTESSEFNVTFTNDTSKPQTIAIFMGTGGQLDGLTQFPGNSTVIAREQDGYEAGRLSSVSVNNEGMVIGTFSNGIKKHIATLHIALFENKANLENIGNGYFIPSVNSGKAFATQALSNGAGSIHSGALEKSNSDIANEFVTIIQAQKGFQTNVRTITVANDILRELTNLIG
jgi:flagellar hook protein FlgE